MMIKFHRIVLNTVGALVNKIPTTLIGNTPDISYAKFNQTVNGMHIWSIPSSLLSSLLSSSPSHYHHYHHYHHNHIIITITSSSPSHHHHIIITLSSSSSSSSHYFTISAGHRYSLYTSGSSAQSTDTYTEEAFGTEVYTTYTGEGWLLLISLPYPHHHYHHHPYY